MRIKSVKFENHPILNNLELNFTDTEGNIVDTVILAGGNGCGKTTLLEELWSFCHNSSKTDNPVKQTTIIKFTEEEIKKIKTLVLEKRSRYPDIFDRTTGEMWICENKNEENLSKRYQINLQNLDLNLEPIDVSFFAIFKDFIRSIYSPVNINFYSNPINTITSLELDKDTSPIKRPSIDLATGIQQLLIDIINADSNDLAQWVEENPNKLPIEHTTINQRMRRFKDAFKEMFKDLNYNRLVNSNGTKQILFKKNGKTITISKLSSGEKQIVYRGAYFLKDINVTNGEFVYIDEPEISLHPEWQKRILNFYKKIFTLNGKQLSQIFVATHSPFIIHNSERYNDKVIVLTHDDEHKIVVMDKPEYYDCTSTKVIEDSFNLNNLEIPDKITFTFEDDAQKFVIDRLLSYLGRQDFVLNKVGSCTNVIMCAKFARQTTSLNSCFLIDGDMSQHDNDIKECSPNFIVLSKYCVENYYLQKSLLEFLFNKFSITQTVDNILKSIITSYQSNPNFNLLSNQINRNNILNWEDLDSLDGSLIIKKICATLHINKPEIFYNEAFNFLEQHNLVEETFKEIIEQIRKFSIQSH